MPIDSSSAETAAANAPARAAALFGQSRDELVGAMLCVLERLGRRGDGIDAVRQRIELGACRSRPLDELRGRLHAIAAAEIGQSLELGLDVL